MSTGNKIVDAMANVNISGNVISPMWYRTVVKDDGKPHFLAIAILSDIVYWYRPRIVRDEATGNVIKATKRFAEDLLQRGSKALAEQFGVSKRQITEALRLLEELNVISRHYRTIERAYGDEKVKITNIQYIELHVDVLKKLSELPQSANENCANGMVENSVGGKVENYPDYEEVPEGETQNYPMLGTKLPDPPTQNRGTNTEITAETTTEITHTHNNARACEGKVKLQPIPFKSPAQIDREKRAVVGSTPPYTQEQRAVAEEYFNQFWAEYPKKQGQVEARLAWMRQNYSIKTYIAIIKAVERFKQIRRDWQTEGGRYVPLPENFLIKARWKDEVKAETVQFDRPMDIALMAGMIMAEEKKNADERGHNIRMDGMARSRADIIAGGEHRTVSDNEPFDVPAVWTP